MARSRREVLKAALRIASAPLVAVPLSQRTAKAAVLIRHPYLQNGRRDRMSILWTTRERGSGAVEFSTDRAFSSAAPASVREFPTAETRLRQPYFQYQADLTGLNPGTEYHYRVLVDGEELIGADDLRLRTAVPSGGFQFVVFGDSGMGTPEQLRLAQMMIRERPALVLHTGDIAYYSGTFEQLENEYFKQYLHLMKRVPLFPCPGNHEYETSGCRPYLAVHAVPSEEVPSTERGRYYSFDWGNAHFLSLDSNESLTAAARGTGKMLEWLDADLQRTRHFWKIAYFHHPPFASGPNENDPQSALARAHLVPILERRGVQLVFGGHEHSYQESHPLRGGNVVGAGQGTVYITSGGGGAFLYPVLPRPRIAYSESAHHYIRVDVDGYRLLMRVIRLDGQEIDRLVLAPPPGINAGAVVNAASFTRSLAPGSLISIFGRQMAADDGSATAVPLPDTIGRLNVTLNGRRIPLLFVSPSQVNAQLPFDVTGQATLRVTTPNGSAETSITIAETAPALFSPASLVHGDGSVITPSSPAVPGEVILVFLTGLGRVTGTITAGQAPASAMAARASVNVQIGTHSVTPLYAGLAPGFVGLYQVNLRLPENLADGVHPLRVVAGGLENAVASNPVNLAVRAPGPGEAGP